MNTEVRARHQHVDYYGAYLSLGYKQEGEYLYSVASGLGPANVPVYGVRFDTGKSGDGTDSENRLFTVLNSLKIPGHSIMPAILTDEYEGEELPDEWISEGPITCGLIYRNNVTFQYNEDDTEANTYLAPFIGQYLPSSTLNGEPLDKPYQVGYADGPNGLPGLVQIFYRQFFAIVQTPETITVRAPLLGYQFQQERFQRLRALPLAQSASTWLALSVRDFNPRERRATYTFIKFVPVTQPVLDAITQY
jgi:hypothetical protein